MGDYDHGVDDLEHERRIEEYLEELKKEEELERQRERELREEQLNKEEELERQRERELREEQELNLSIEQAAKNTKFNKNSDYTKKEREKYIEALNEGLLSRGVKKKRKPKKVVIQDVSPEPGGSLTKRVRSFRRSSPETRSRYLHEQIEHIYNPNAFGKSRKLRLIERDLKYLLKYRK